MIEQLAKILKVRVSSIHSCGPPQLIISRASERFSEALTKCLGRS
jgi:hypothetical protein